MSLSGGIDLCAFPAGTPPESVAPDFTNPPTYAPVVFGVSAVVLFFATLFTGCRLTANWKKLTWTDHFNTFALIFSLVHTSLVLCQLKYARHQWDIPACWFLGEYAKALTVTPGLIFSKASVLLLFHTIFDIQPAMRIAIRIGFAAIICAAPGVYWGIVQAAGGTLLDLYIFILPLPDTTQL
ncbi:hypothetical protein INS49_009241 [Diaporthe citri]|uniref:uncharacterized protein n=1 Tax=Diaporthe citri TaxID=83186 RepID=UPI001C81BB1B|nr:uncharacterized protein INS49_009241 [Diaporthe citri]KAG6361022.1 hypothetical protein INS49_009241 [Diaporthe citri]